MNRLRPSFYNVSVRVDENEYLLMNPLSGSADVVDKDVIDFLESFKDTLQHAEAKPEIIQTLRARTYLTQRDKEEEIEMMSKRCKYLNYVNKSYSHQFTVTYDCNMRCAYCFENPVKTKGKKRTRILDRKQVDRIFDVIVKLDSDINVDTSGVLSLWGGEPFMPETKDIVRYIFKKGTELGYRFGYMNTNGLALMEFVEMLEEYRIPLVKVTLDGPPEIHDTRRKAVDGSGTFDRIVEGIEALSATGVKIGLRTNIDSANVDHVPSLLDFYVSQGWHEDPHFGFALMPTYGAWWGDKELSWRECIQKVEAMTRTHPLMNIFETKWETRIFGYPRPYVKDIVLGGKCILPNSHYCNGFMVNMLYDPYGDIYTCLKLSGEPEHKVGVYMPEFHLNKNYTLWQERSIFNIPECRNCSYSPLCRGGSAYRAYLKTGNLMEPHCDTFKDFLEVFVPQVYRQFKERRSQGFQGG
ncbi:MAG: radical SAM protein [Theionarchaea archaeon]|nr:radical SAM protein [Theionarchaea archaeon]MBU7001922.1 radical SAM protein [Theionarchaea archaeon]MBU7020409.1 radical SAM protein [Theionarchaea archaeon]